jgi:hypothetical protein
MLTAGLLNIKFEEIFDSYNILVRLSLSLPSKEMKNVTAVSNG